MPAELTTDLAYDRTKLAHERTLMAWVRTATSLISFGFTIYKFFDEIVPNRPHTGFGSRPFALAMISIGLLSLLLACIQHMRSIRELNQHLAPTPYSLALPIALLIGALGVFGFIVVAFHL